MFIIFSCLLPCRNLAILLLSFMKKKGATKQIQQESHKHVDAPRSNALAWYKFKSIPKHGTFKSHKPSKFFKICTYSF